MSNSSKHIQQFDRAYFLGIGGIGMSALARYFNSKGWKVAGYDKTATPLTDKLMAEGIEIHFEDFGPSIPENFRNISKTLVVYTPAIPVNMGELMHFQHNEFALHKRAEVLGMITRDSKALGVAGTHGKTTTSTILAHVLNESKLKCNAFLGGISTNFNSNFISDSESNFTVIEADEFDRSFLQLNPFASIITSTDADHLDIYGNNDDFLEGFRKYAALIDKEGFLIRHKDVELEHSNSVSYGLEKDADYIGKNIRFEGGKFLFDLNFNNQNWNNIELGIPGIHNAENAIACIAMCLNLGLNEDEIRYGLATFKGVKRRFEYQVKKQGLIYIDDYAHHPTEIKALVDSVKLLYPNQKITGIFQPHLFSRTRDFFDDFAAELSQLDEVILLPIYPAREEPILGITSDTLLNKIEIQEKVVLSPVDAIEKVTQYKSGIILTIGAGDIDKIVSKIKNGLKDK